MYYPVLYYKMWVSEEHLKGGEGLTFRELCPIGVREAGGDMLFGGMDYSVWNMLKGVEKVKFMWKEDEE